MPSPWMTSLRSAIPWTVAGLTAGVVLVLAAGALGYRVRDYRAVLVVLAIAGVSLVALIEFLPSRRRDAQELEASGVPSWPLKFLQWLQWFFIGILLMDLHQRDVGLVEFERELQEEEERHELDAAESKK
jgi:hypothetical protein